MEELIAKRYVRALLSLIEEKDRDEIADILNGISLSFSDAKTIEMIKSPFISSDIKVETILKSLGGDVDTRLTNFIKMHKHHLINNNNQNK